MSESLRISESTSARNSWRLARLRVPPRLRDEACGQRGVAIDDLAVDCLSASPACASTLPTVSSASVPSLRAATAQSSDSVAGRARGDHHAQLALEPQHVLAQALAFEPARGELGEQRADDAATANGRSRRRAASGSTSGKS